MVEWIITGGLTWFASSQSIEATICQPLFQPVITSLASSSSLSDNPLHIEGTGDSSVSHEILLNNTRYAVIVADNTNVFSADVNLPQTGTYQVSVVATNPCERKSSVVHLVEYTPPTPVIPPVSPPSPSHPPSGQDRLPPSRTSTTPPAPMVFTSPNNQDFSMWFSDLPQNMTVHTASFFLKGTLSFPGTVRITNNGRVVAETFMPALTFGTRLPLEEGPNDFKVVATSNNQSIEASLQLRYVRDTNPVDQPLVICQNIWQCILPIIIAIVTLLGLWFLYRRQRDKQPTRPRSWQ